VRKAVNHSTVLIEDNYTLLNQKGVIAGDSNKPKEKIDVREMFTFENIGKTIA
jgi:hypothetical protein